MAIHISATNLLLAVGDFLTIYLFGYMHRTFCTKREWIKNRKILVPIIYFLDWIMLFTANMMGIPPLNLTAMLASYVFPFFSSIVSKGQEP